MQAVNIVQVYEKDPKAKIIIYAGHGHIKKTPSKTWTPMAYYLQELLPNKKIIAIDQTTYIDNYGIDNSVNKILNDSLDIKEPKLLIHKDSFPQVKDGSFDAYLINPDYKGSNYWYYNKNEINTEKIDLNIPKNAFYVEIIPTMFLKNKIAVFKCLIKNLEKQYIYLPKDKCIINYYSENLKLLTSSNKNLE